MEQIAYIGGLILIVFGVWGLLIHERWYFGDWGPAVGKISGWMVFIGAVALIVGVVQ